MKKLFSFLCVLLLSAWIVLQAQEYSAIRDISTAQIHETTDFIVENFHQSMDDEIESETIKVQGRNNAPQGVFNSPAAADYCVVVRKNNNHFTIHLVNEGGAFFVQKT